MMLKLYDATKKELKGWRRVQPRPLVVLFDATKKELKVEKRGAEKCGGYTC